MGTLQRTIGVSERERHFLALFERNQFKSEHGVSSGIAIQPPVPGRILAPDCFPDSGALSFNHSVHGHQ